jgi:hypothetical protein
VVAGGEGNVRGTRAVGFKQETWEDGEFATMNKGSPFQVSYFLSANTRLLNFLCVQDKQEFSVLVKNIKCVGIRNMHTTGPQGSEQDYSITTQ